MFIIETTNKFAMNSRQPDSGLRQYNCTGPGQVVGPTWRKVYKNTLITWRQLPSLSLEVEGDRGAPGTPAHPYTKRCGRRRSGRGQRCWTWTVILKCLISQTCAIHWVWKGFWCWEIPWSTLRSISLCILVEWCLQQSDSILHHTIWIQIESERLL